VTIGLFIFEIVTLGCDDGVLVACEGGVSTARVTSRISVVAERIAWVEGKTRTVEQVSLGE